MNHISHNQLPKPALGAISKNQRSYIDEFSFYELTGGNILAMYAGEKLAVWNGKNWSNTK